MTLISTLVVVAVFCLIGWIYIEMIPFEIFSFWRMTGTPEEWFFSAWPFITFGILWSTFFLLTKKEFPRITLSQATLISLRAGVFEEFAFRWWFFLVSIPGLYICNWLLGGFCGPDWGLINFLYSCISGPIADFTSGGWLSEYFYHEQGWLIGAALVSSNCSFRDGHKYQGFIGWVDSWFFGLGMFILFFEYGLFVAMTVHFVYNFYIFGFWAIKSTIVND